MYAKSAAENLTNLQDTIRIHLFNHTCLQREWLNTLRDGFFSRSLQLHLNGTRQLQKGGIDAGWPGVGQFVNALLCHLLFIYQRSSAAPILVKHAIHSFRASESVGEAGVALPVITHRQTIRSTPQGFMSSLTHAQRNDCDTIVAYCSVICRNELNIYF